MTRVEHGISTPLRTKIRNSVRSKVAGDAGAAVLLQIADMALRLISLKLLTTRMSQSEFGEYGFIVSVVGLGYLLFGLELFRFLQRNVYRVARPESYLAPALAVELGLCLVATSVAAAHADKLSAFFGIGLSPFAIFLLGILLAGEIVFVELTRFHLLLRNVKLVEGTKLLRTCAIVLLLAAWPVLSPTAYIWIALIGVTIALFPLVASHQRRNRSVHPSDEWGSAGARLAQVFAYTWPFLVPAFAYHMLKFGDRFFVAAYLEVSQLGLYHLANSLQMLCYTLGAGTLAVILHPVVMKHYDEGRPEYFVKAFILKLAIQLVFSVGLALLARPLLVLLTTEEYLAALPIVWLLFPLPVLILAYGTVTSYLFLAGYRLQFGVNNVLAVAVTVAGYLLLIPRMGISGAAIATLVGYTTVLLVFGLQVAAGRAGLPFGIQIRRSANGG